MRKLDQLGIDALCDAVIRGDSLNTIAKRTKVDIAMVLKWIESDPQRSARAWDARRVAAWHWDEEAANVLKTAETHVDITRARELASHYRWRASRTNQRYADKVDVHHSGSITLEALITRSLDTPLIGPTIEPQDDD